ncbi:hypothetical protein ACG10_22380 (plasmid) [Azotobacter chroococcum]|nr:hypothetical protein ACG10_22380 [Azotobacter chroococcum]
MCQPIQERVARHQLALLFVAGTQCQELDECNRLIALLAFGIGLDDIGGRPFWVITMGSVRSNDAACFFKKLIVSIFIAMSYV